MSTYATPNVGSDPANTEPFRRGDQREGFPPPDLTSFTPSDLAMYQQLQQVVGQISNLADVLQQTNRKITERQIQQVEIPPLNGGQLFPVVGGAAGLRIAVVNYVLSVRTAGANQWQWLSGKFRATATQISGRSLGNLGFTTTAEAGIVPIIGTPDSPVLITDVAQDLVFFCVAGNLDGGHLSYYTIETGP